jgi:transcriptional regulator with XRE-family HTH domain
MLFEWDEAKSGRNLSERGFGFDYAARIFLGPTLEKPDDRRDYGEIRIQAIGQVGTQEEFAKALRIPLPTLRNWEQGRVLPDPAARSLLTIVAKNPKAALKALSA